MFDNSLCLLTSSSLLSRNSNYFFGKHIFKRQELISRYAHFETLHLQVFKEIFFSSQCKLSIGFDVIDRSLCQKVS